MKVTHVSTNDLIGGAARSAYRLHTGLRSLGHDSRLLVLTKQSADPSVVPFEPEFDLLTRLRRRVTRQIIERTQYSLKSRPSSAGFFSDDRSQYGGDMLTQCLPCDILHLHWVSGFVDCTRFFRNLPKQSAFVWTLHDMNPFTGGCHHAYDCPGYVETCGRCPQLNSTREHDFSRAVWQRKNRAYGSIKPLSFSVVAPSRWLASKVKESALMRAFETHAIPYGVDIDSFQPLDREKARTSLRVPPQARVLLFVSQWLDDRYKGLATLLQTLERLAAIPHLCLVTIGSGELPTHLPVPGIAFGPVLDESSLALAYSAADVLVLPSLQDNFPNTALEALACGLPVVGSRVGGIPEIVRPDFTGFLVEPDNPEALASAITELLGNEERRKQMSANCRHVAVAEYSLETQARRYSELYETLLRKNTAN